MSDEKVQQFIGIKQLVAAFDSEHGLPWPAFNAACNLIESIMGVDAARTFTLYLDATDDNFYFDTTGVAETCWKQMLYDAGLNSDAYDYLHDLTSEL